MNLLNELSNDTKDENKPNVPKGALIWMEEESKNIYTIWDEYGKLMYITKSVERLLGVPPFEFENKKWYQFLDKEARKVILQQMRDIVTGESVTSRIKLKNHLGKNEWFEYKIKQIKENDTVSYAVILEHLCEKESYDEVLIQSEKMAIAGQLAASVVHEIRNPLTSIKGFVQLLQSGIEAQPAYFDIMIEEIEKMEAMTTELLFISRPLTEKKKLESINDMVEETLILLQTQTEKINIDLQFIKNEDITMYCNRSQMKQILINLIKNAIEAIQKDGEILIQSHIIKNDNCIYVSDDGPGIPDDVIDKLDQPFFTTKEEGTGLGLMITKELWSLHNGTLVIKANQTAGSTFRLILPKDQDANESP